MNKECTPGHCTCHEADAVMPKHASDIEPLKRRLLKFAAPTATSFHRLLVTMESALTKVRTAAGAAANNKDPKSMVAQIHQWAALQLPPALRPLEIGQPDPVMLAIGRTLAAAEKKVLSMSVSPLLVVAMAVEAGGKDDILAARLQSMKEAADMEEMLESGLFDRMNGIAGEALLDTGSKKVTKEYEEMLRDPRKLSAPPAEPIYIKKLVADFYERENARIIAENKCKPSS